MHHLAPFLLSVLFASTAYGRAVNLTPRAQSKTLVSASVYEDLVHYAQYVPATDQACARPPHGATLLQFINVPSTDTQAALFRSDAREEFVLNFEESASIRDIITDATVLPVPYLAPGVQRCGLCTVHAGFLTAWNSALPDIDQAVRSAMADNPSYTLVITGASLGGALAELAYGSFAPQSSYRVTRLYSYGAPRVGNQAYANYIDRLSGVSASNPGAYYRVTHANDIIPQIPPNLLASYVHPQTEYWESTMVPAQNTTYGCFGQEPDDCNNSAPPDSRSLQAHASYAGFDYSCSS